MPNYVPLLCWLIIFAGFLYRPQIQTEAETFNIYTSHKFVKVYSRQRANLPHLTPDTITLESFEWSDHPLESLVGSLGVSLKNTKRIYVTPTRNSSPSFYGSSTRHDNELINAYMVLFDTLDAIASIKIEWVDTIDLHLAFSSRTKVLSIFRFPSYCLFMRHSKPLVFQDRLVEVAN